MAVTESCFSDENWHEIAAKDAIKKLNSSENGLDESEAESRLTKFGYNELQKEKGVGKLEIFISQFKSILIIILIAATIFSALVGEIVDAAAIVIIVVLNAIFGFFQEYKAEKTIEALKKLTSPEAVVIRGGREMKIESKLLVPGDVVVVEEGSRIPADMRLVSEAELKIDEAILTGESFPVSKGVEPIKAASIADRRCMAYMGTLVTYGRGMGVVVGTGMKTEMGKIASVVQKEEEQPTPLQKKLSSFGKILGIIIVVICTLVIVIGIAREGPLSGQPVTETLIITIIITGIALAVAAIPEGLPAIMTITLALGLQRLAKKNALMRKLPAVEALGSTTVICSDKTGTLTKNEMTISRIWCPDSAVEVTGEGYKPEGKFVIEGKDIDKKTGETVSFTLRIGALCTNAKLEKNEGEYSIIGDPTEGAIMVAAEKMGISKETMEKENKRTYEMPFSSERKMMTTINAYGRKQVSCVKGATEVITKLCDKIMIQGKPVKITDAWKEKIASMNHEMTGSALRVLAIAYREMDKEDKKEAERSLVFLGLVGMIDPPREEAIESVKVCRKAGIRVVMITGDHQNTAIAVAKQLGIFSEGDRSMTGEEMDSVSDKDLEKISGEISVFARVNPLQDRKSVV